VQLGDLTIHAATGGIVQSVAVDPGQRITAGTEIARLADEHDLKAVLQVAESDVHAVAPGMRVRVTTSDGTTIAGRISRIAPAAQNGTVAVDVALATIPRGTRPDQTVDGTIVVRRVADALSIARPANAADGSVTLYRLDAAGTAAVRTRVVLAGGSSDRARVVGGLTAGERVIVSDTSAYEAPLLKIHTWDDAMLIEVNDVSKVYRTEEIETRALRGISLSIERGEYVAIEGPSGCGKSTLLSILGLLDTPTSGSYVLADREVARLTGAERSRIRNRDIGFIFQNFNLIGDLTVAENVELPLTYRGTSTSERKRRVAEALERVAMSHRAGHHPPQLSGGQQQRVAVARAIAGDPEVLLADEPTGNLDTTNGELVMELLAELHRAGSTIVMVTHDRRFNRFASRTIDLLDGTLTKVDAPQAVPPAIAAG